ncbi:RNA-directed DNA polymerase, eukaryota [Tanacetum coccineum]
MVRICLLFIGKKFIVLTNPADPSKRDPASAIKGIRQAELATWIWKDFVISNLIKSCRIPFCWIGDVPLRVKFPRLFALDLNKEASVAVKLSAPIDISFRRNARGGIEEHLLADLTSLMDSVTLSNSGDRWVCDLVSDGNFRVKEIRNYIDDLFLPHQAAQTRWIKYIPIKVNIFAWRARQDCLPTRVNLIRRGITIESSLCPVCSVCEEDVCHIFFRCDLAQLVLRRICRWWGLDPHDWSSFQEWQSWILSIQFSSKMSNNLSGKQNNVGHNKYSSEAGVVGSLRMSTHEEEFCSTVKAFAKLRGKMAKEQIHVEPKEDIELAKKANELKKEEIEAKSKEQQWLQEKSKATKALRRKERNAEKAPIRAHLRAWKEAKKKIMYDSSVGELWLNPGQKQNSRKPLIISYEGASGDFTGCTDQPEPLRLKGKLILLLRASNLRIRTVVYDYMIDKLYAENKTQQKAFEDEIERATIHAQQQISVAELKYAERFFLIFDHVDSIGFPPACVKAKGAIAFWAGPNLIVWLATPSGLGAM